MQRDISNIYTPADKFLEILMPISSKAVRDTSPKTHLYLFSRRTIRTSYTYLLTCVVISET